MKSSLLINKKMATIVGIFIFISREIFMLSKVSNFRFISMKNFMLSWAEHEKSFISSGSVCCLLNLFRERKRLICAMIYYVLTAFSQIFLLSV